MKQNITSYNKKIILKIYVKFTSKLGGTIFCPIFCQISPLNDKKVMNEFEFHVIIVHAVSHDCICLKNKLLVFPVHFTFLPAMCEKS